MLAQGYDKQHQISAAKVPKISRIGVKLSIEKVEWDSCQDWKLCIFKLACCVTFVPEPDVLAVLEANCLTVAACTLPGTKL